MTNFEYLTFSVKWSSQLEKLADELLRCWQDTVQKNPDPFGKICIVVNDSSTENWLKQYFLLHCKNVIMNLEFIRLPEFINDWLAAELHGIDPRSRQASVHPYSTGILTWRIYNILSTESPDGDLKELLEYIGEDKKHLRRYALSEKLAVLYDDYLNSRGQMLRNWEEGRPADTEMVSHWQISLYQKLVSKDNRTYAADYEKVFSTGIDAKLAFEYGFPRYLAVHVFDIPFMPETTLHLLEKISEAFPEKMTFWHFNPSRDWLGDSVSKREVIREIRTSLHNGAIPPDKSIADIFKDAYESTNGQLFGALASGARAMIYNLCNDAEGRVDIIGDKETIDELKNRKIFLHKCYSPRRELEIIKDGLLRFFDENKGVHPHDIAVLCADWENYAPIIESVFSSDPESEGYIPIAVAGKTAGETPFFQSLRNLLSFRENRFEAGDVFTLLDFPAISRKYDFASDEVISVLRDMVNKANIRWGYDDADVQHILEVEPEPNYHYPFTWQRGMDRMTAELFHGFNEDEYTFVNIDNLGEFQPCGFVEGEREEYAASLWQLIANLKWLRDTFAEGREADPDEIQKDLLEVIRRFYDENDGAILNEANKTRQAIRNTAGNMKDAGIEKIEIGVFLASMLSSLSGSVSGMKTTGDSVLFAPLNCSNAVPRELIWICGLNDGAFPKIEYRASYDLIGKHPSWFDVTCREKDAFALLKAVLSARKQLSFSFIGMDNRSNDDLPPSVLLTDLKDYFAAKKILYTEYVHPMHACDKRYFTENSGLPLSYSSINRAIVDKLKEKHKGKGITPFPLSDNSATNIQLDQLVEFFSGPNQYLFRSQGIHVEDCQYTRINSKDCLDAYFDKKLKTELILTGRCHIAEAKKQVEIGRAPNQQSAESEIKSLGTKCGKMSFKFREHAQYNCNSLLIAEVFHRFETAEVKEQLLELEAGGHKINLYQKYAVIDVPCTSGKYKFMIFYDLYSDSSLSRNKALLRYLAANAAEGGIGAVLFDPKKKHLLLPELSAEKAKAMLAEIITLAGTPLPAEFPGCWMASPKTDALPREWQETLDRFFNAAKGN